MRRRRNGDLYGPDVLTEPQLRILLLVIGHIKRKQYPPSFSWLAKEVGSTINSVVCHLKALKRKGFITWEFDKTHTLRPLVRFIPADDLARFARGPD